MRILLVEDERRLAAMLAKGLRENTYAVDIAHDGDEGSFLASVNPYDLIILDVNLPRKDGFAVCRELREAGNKSPVLMLTARDAVEDRVAGLDYGADDYLVKPFEFRELLARIRALLRRRPEISPAVIRTADLEIDTAARTVRRGGRSIELTAKEYSFLEFLALNKGRVVGREEISEHVWDETFDPFTNAIEVYIKRLRDKIDAGSDVRLIETRRGLGYLLRDV